MKEFCFAFLENKEHEIAEKLGEAFPKEPSALPKKAVLPGCSVQTRLFSQGPCPNVALIFNEHCGLTPEETEALNAHQSLCFIVGEYSTKTSIAEINKLVQKILNWGALGVYAEHSGTAYTKDSFFKYFDLENPIEPWVNFIETKTDIYSLGLEVYGMPDMCVAKKTDDETDIINTLAFAIWNREIEAASMVSFEIDENRYEFRKELKTIYSKGDAEYNPLGVLRIIRK